MRSGLAGALLLGSVVYFGRRSRGLHGSVASGSVRDAINEVGHRAWYFRIYAKMAFAAAEQTAYGGWMNLDEACANSIRQFHIALDALREARSALRHPRIIQAYQFYTQIPHKGGDEYNILTMAGEDVTRGYELLKLAKQVHDSACSRPVPPIPLSGAFR